MKKFLLGIVIFLAMALGANAENQSDTLKVTTNNLEFTTIDDGVHKAQKVVTYNGKAYTYTGSITAYKRQLKYFGDCRILIVGDKIIIL